MVAGLVHPHSEIVLHFAPFPRPHVALYMISQSIPEYLIHGNTLIQESISYTLLFRALQLYRLVPQDRIWFSKYPSFQGVFPLFEKPWGRGCKVPSPWIGSRSSPGRFSATSKPREKRPGDEVEIGYSFWYYFPFDRVLKKTEARPCLTKSMFTPCRIVFLADTKLFTKFCVRVFRL